MKLECPTDQLVAERLREHIAVATDMLRDQSYSQTVARVAEAYGVWGEKVNYGKTYMGIIRSTFLIAPDGQIARVWPKVKAAGHAAEVLEALDQLRAVPG